MRNKLFILTYLTLSGYWLTGHSQHITEFQARTNALTFLTRHSTAMSKVRTKTPSLKLSFSSNNFYAFDYEGGFILASSDEQLPSILGYSDRGNFSDAMKNPCYRAFIKQYEQIYRPDFRIYKPSNVAEYVEPLCKDSWHQYTPFNDKAPLTSDGESHCLTGCVATSLSELLYFYKYPDQGIGYISYKDSTGSGLVLSTDFSTHKYDWQQMLDSYDGTYSSSSAEAVSQLLYDCGVSVRMRYRDEDSGAQTIYQPIALVNHFRYDEGVQIYYHNFFNQVEWDSIMFNELNAGRPMLVGGWTGGGGHSYVCDGYDSNGLFHLRLGYPNEDGNGYYYFTWSTPDLPLWRDVNSPEIGWNVLQCILVGITPKTSSAPSPQRYIYGFSDIKSIEDDVDSTNENEICVAVHDLCNCGWNEHRGTVGIAMKPFSEGIQTPTSSTLLLYTYDRVFSLEELTDSTYSDTLKLIIPPNTIPGTYKIVPVYEENGNYHEARTMQGMPNCLRLNVNSDGITLEEYEEGFSKLEISDVDFPSLIYRYTCPPYGFTLTNHGADYSGRLYISLYDEAVPGYNNTFSIQGVTIEHDEVQRYEFVRTNILKFPLGKKFHLRISADESLLNYNMNVLWDDSLNRIEVQELPTSIEEPEKSPTSEESAIYYDLSGQRINDSSSLSKGRIFIERDSNGKILKKMHLNR